MSIGHGSLQMGVNEAVLKVENGGPMKSGSASLQVGVEDARARGGSLVGKSGTLQRVLRENVELKAQLEKLRSSRVILGQSSSQRGDEGKKQQGMVSASINSVNFPVVDHEGCRKRKEEIKSQLGKPRLAGDGGCEVDSGLPSGVPASSLNGKSIKDPAIKEPSITFPFSQLEGAHRKSFRLSSKSSFVASDALGIPA